MESVKPPYIKVLHSMRSEELLRRMKTESRLPVITKPADYDKVLEGSEYHQSYQTAVELVDLKCWQLTSHARLPICPARLQVRNSRLRPHITSGRGTDLIIISSPHIINGELYG